jgi:hypothetical protein
MSRKLSRRPSPAFVVSLFALFFALSGWGYAATGGTFNLGKKNKADKTTKLTASSKKGPALQLKSTGGKSAASFKVQGAAPFTVNSAQKVRKLNADRLDGLDSSALQRRVQACAVTGAAIQQVNADGSVDCVPTWNLSGNSGTTPGIDFLGTSDDQPLVVKTNDAEAMRVAADGKVGVGTTSPGAQLEALSSDIALMGTSTSRAIIGRLGAGVSCPGSYAVGGCAGATDGDGVRGIAGSGNGVAGFAEGSGNGVSGLAEGSGNGVSGVASSGNGVSGRSDTGRALSGFSASGIGVIGDSTTRAVIGTLGGGSCAGTYAVGGCGGDAGDGVVGRTSTSAAVRGIVTDAAGSIFVGQAGGTTTVRINNQGKGFFDGGTQTGGADYAESMRTTERAAKLEPGDVLAIDPRTGHAVRRSRRPNSQLVAGVYSTKPSVLAVGRHGVGDSLDGEVPVAMLGVVPTKVTAENGSIRPGDLLTTSKRTGRAMKASAVRVHGVAIYPTGSILGKAIEPLRHGNGTIKALVMLR